MDSVACINTQFETIRNVPKLNHLSHPQSSRKVFGSETGSQAASLTNSRVDHQVNFQANSQAKLQANSQATSQANFQVDQQANTQADLQTSSQANSQAASQTDSQINCNTPNMNALLDERVTGRVGSSILPVLPVQTIAVPNLEEKLPNWPTHKQQVQQILDRHGITGIVQVAYRRHSESELYDKHITILVIAEYRPDSKTTWPKAVREILRYLYQVNVQYTVEIIADALDVGLECFPFATDVYQWNKVLMPAVCSLVHGRDWLTLQMVYVEDVQETDQKQPTIFIGARDADEKSWWDETLPAIRNLPHVAHSDIQVVLRYQHQYLTTDADSILLEKSFRNVEIPMGASCGSGAPTGTLGGQIILKDPRTSVEQRMGITNHHVLCGDLTGQGPFTKFKCSIEVQSPSNKDRRRYRKTLKKRVKMQKRELEKVIEKQNRYSVQEFQDKEDNARTKLNQVKGLLRQAKAFDIHVGEVYASSGFRHARKGSVGEWALDWSLTTTNRDVSDTTDVPNSYERKSVTKYCTIKPDQGYRVFKTGRTSGTTTGFISATQATLRWSKMPRPKNGQTVQLADLWDYPEKHARCHVMIPEPNPRSDYFIKRGDSGSLILLDPNNFALPGETTTATTSGAQKRGDGRRLLEAYIAGLGFAAFDHAFISYMMPMDVIVKDIEKVTGLEVVEPSHFGTFPPQDANSPA